MTENKLEIQNRCVTTDNENKNGFDDIEQLHSNFRKMDGNEEEKKATTATKFILVGRLSKKNMYENKNGTK